MKSLITTPASNAVISGGQNRGCRICVGGQNDVTKVDISTDNGATWQPAKLTGEQARFTWRRFEFEFTATKPQSYLISLARDGFEGQHAAGGRPGQSVGYLLNRCRLSADRNQVKVAMVPRVPMVPAVLGSACC